MLPSECVTRERLKFQVPSWKVQRSWTWKLEVGFACEVRLLVKEAGCLAVAHYVPCSDDL